MAEISRPSRFIVKSTASAFSGDDERSSAKDAGYMELDGAIKGADCELVKIEGGVSTELGCCNLYKAQAIDTRSFKCGVCKYLVLK